jgi:2-C-methyl-D-erythritol 4-phosphate cytidylyltransferase
MPGTIMICENNQIIKTQQRCRTKIGQAPQVYKLKELLQYIHKSEAENVNFDDFEDFFLYYGKTIYAYECVDDSNLKVTTQDDLAVLKNKIFKK